MEAVRADVAAGMRGMHAEVLLETPLSATLFTGYTRQYLPVVVQAPGHQSGDIVACMHRRMGRPARQSRFARGLFG